MSLISKGTARAKGPESGRTFLEQCASCAREYVGPRLASNHRVTEAGCWQWTGYANHHGYGRIFIKLAGEKGRLLAAHRLSYEYHVGPIPDGMVVMHLCDNRGCINPDHMVLGTQAANLADARLKGRNRGSLPIGRGL